MCERNTMMWGGVQSRNYLLFDADPKVSFMTYRDLFNIIQNNWNCSFRVGSPPSSGASLGSDQSEMIRRALEFGGPSLADEIIGSPEIGSAVRYV